MLEGSPAQVRSQFGTQICRLELDSAADAVRAGRELLPARLGLEADGFTIEGLSVSFTAAGGADDLAAALAALREADIPVTSATLSAPSLDDVFLELAFADAAPTKGEH
ncbi:DUF4162 domain-containing protein [Microbacterium sp.]|uniref:ATP-binding protein DrrA1-3 family domain-containing protein n=1 Tax=Microbacterium sp. TaxID=51671 RepID=UPI003C75AE27